MTNQPNTARVNALSTWCHFFHPETGIFRLPSEQGALIQHLEIDLRFVDESDFSYAKSGDYAISLPNVCKLTLRGGEYCQDDEARVDCLVEVLMAINPVEVLWLHAKHDVQATFSLATHMVHHAIIQAGQTWAERGVLKKLTVQGGYPCPNLTAPTPFAVTPAHTPLNSPGFSKLSLATIQSTPTTPTLSRTVTLHTIPNISSTKPKPVNASKAKERAERQRLADYALKPRFEYAFGAWGPDELRWSFDGLYKPAAIYSIISNLIKAFSASFPFSTPHADLPLPSLLAFKPIPMFLVPKLQGLVNELDLEADLIAYFEDVMFIAAASVNGETRWARLFDQSTFDQDDRERLTRRFKAEMLLVQQPHDLLTNLAELTGGIVTGVQTSGKLETSVDPSSPSVSLAGLSTDDGTTTDGDEGEAVTPELSGSLVQIPISPNGNKQEKAKLLASPDGNTMGLDIHGLTIS